MRTREEDREYYYANHDRILEKRRLYRIKNKDKVKFWDKKYRLKKFYGKCLVCNKPLKNKNAKRCKSHSKAGYLHHNWRGGYSIKDYPFEWNKTFKELIRERDGRMCRLCGIREENNSRKLNVHHIDYNKKNLNIDNLLSLCDWCHAKTNTNHSYWIKTFGGENVRV